MTDPEEPRGHALVPVRPASAALRALRVLKTDAAFTTGILRRRPFNVLYQVTNRCNMRCSFCDFWPHPAPPREELSLEEVRRVADELAELGTFLVSVEGGEPLARKDLPGIVAAFSRHHLTALFTNGWYVTEENARALFDAGLTHASVSIDYPDAGRHDDKRRLAGATDRAWEAVELLRDAAPRGGRQVNVMTVVMQSNHEDLEELLEQSARRGVGHQVTLLSRDGFRRGGGPDRLPPPGIGARLAELWERFEHLRWFRSYFDRMDTFLSDGPMPTCRAGVQGFNLDHVGNVSPCIERIDRVVGNVRDEPLAVLHQRLVDAVHESEACNRCWTACRGIQQQLGDGGTLRDLRDLASRTRSW